nr:MAG TPA: hypothetical protein [Caudoviricetes sp.]
MGLSWWDFAIPLEPILVQNTKNCESYRWSQYHHP